MDSLDYQKYVEKTRRAIPPELCFENVVANRAMPVDLSMTLSIESPLISIAMLSSRLHGLLDERLA